MGLNGNDIKFRAWLLSKPWAIATVALNVKKPGSAHGLVAERVAFLFELYQRPTP